MEKDLDYEYNYFEMFLHWMKKQVLIFFDTEKLSIFVSQQSIYFFTKKDYRELEGQEMKYSETTLQTWTAPLSSTEEERVENTIKMIKDAIRSHNELSLMTYEIFAQGSYANNTNVRQNSDIDICVMLTSTFYGNYEDGTKASDYGFSDGSISFSDFRKYVIEALRDKFGNLNVKVGNKCIDIDANSYHVNADVVPAFQYRDYKIIHSKKADRFVEGIKFFTQNNEMVINYPKEHLKNGREKIMLLIISIRS